MITRFQIKRALHICKPPTEYPPIFHRYFYRYMIGMGIYVGGGFYLDYKYNKRINTLTENEFRDFYLCDIIPLTQSSSLFRFSADNPTTSTYPVPSHVVVKDDSCQIAREYTPITFHPKYFDLLVKKYPNGTVSRYIHQLKIGDPLSMRGPVWSFPYIPNQTPHITFIAGGTGITPFYQLIKSILKDPNDQTHITLLYSCTNQDEILLRNELDLMVESFPRRFKVLYTVDDPTNKSNEPINISNQSINISEEPVNKVDEKLVTKWQGHVGRIGRELIKQHVPGPNENGLIVLCGPKGMIDDIAGSKIAFNDQGPLLGVLKELGYSSEKVFKL